MRTRATGYTLVQFIEVIATMANILGIHTHTHTHKPKTHNYVCVCVHVCRYVFECILFKNKGKSLSEMRTNADVAVSNSAQAAQQGSVLAMLGLA